MNRKAVANELIKIAKELVAKSNLTKEEEDAIIRAASTTWQYVASDAAELGPITLAVALELVTDAGRMVTLGGLDKKLWDKANKGGYKEVDALLKKNKNAWYGR